MCDTSAPEFHPPAPTLFNYTYKAFMGGQFLSMHLARVAASLVKLSVWQCCGGALTAVHG